MASKLKDLRKSLNLSSTKLSYLLGVNQSTISRYEKSEEEKTISLSVMEKYLSALGYKLEYRFKKIEGIKRPKAKGRLASTLSQTMKEEEQKRVKELSPINKLKMAYELSLFLKKLKEC